MRHIKTALLPLAAALLLASCGSSNELAYVHDAQRDTAVSVSEQFLKGIQANDILYIYVESGTPESTIPFNQETNKIAMASGTVMNPGSSAVSGYLVNSEGDITFPVLGKIHVMGLTHTELAKMLETRLVTDGHITDPVVTVKLMNFRVSVLGEVVRPGQIEASGERLTIFEALAMVGDLTIYGLRENVMVVREENGMRTVGTIDLTSKDVFSSPYYYLHQNDMVYVEPNMRRKRTAAHDPVIQGYISIGLSALTTISTLVYHIILSNTYLKK
ncbi:MAG: polysaccharide biosynthesis/export family protein [Bacteroidales bacterium]|nr:polysaccharide biosynthesis/export family protein [Bacteroidales bacterium]